MNKSDKTLSYMLFILGVFLISIGIFLSTYTTVAFINTTFNYGFGSFTIPVATQIQPYRLIGIITILSGVVFISIGLYETQKKPQQPVVPSPPNMPVCTRCGKEVSEETNYCPSCGTPLHANKPLVQEKLAELRQRETEATITAVVGFVVFLMTFVFPLSFPFFMILGFAIMISMAAFSSYYSREQKKLMKKLE